jgi:hypothetical protein
MPSASMTRGRRWDTVLVLSTAYSTPPSGATAASSTWELCRAPEIAKPSASTTRGRQVGVSVVGGVGYATEWSHGRVIDLGGLLGSTYSEADGINDAGQAVGESEVGGVWYATEWSHGSIINLGGLPGPAGSASFARGINDRAQAVGESGNVFGVPVPESSTWAMMLLGFAGLGFAGYRRTRKAA